MRSLLWALVLVNLVYFGWRQLAMPAPAQPPQAGAPSLTLLSEAPGVDLIPVPADTPPQDLPAEPLPEPPPTAEPVVAQESAPADAAAPPTLSAAPPPEPPPERSRTCAVVTGLTASEPAVSLVQALKGAGIDAYTVSGDEQISSVWWVYLPKFASEQLARSTLTELRDKGIDSYYLTSGELAGGISLGVFARREGALSTQADLAKRGYSASIQETVRSAVRYRVVAESTREALLAAPQARDFMARNAGLEVADFVCEGVAEAR